MKNIIFKRQLLSPEELKNQMPLSEEGKEIKQKRDQKIANVFKGEDNRFILIIG